MKLELFSATRFRDALAGHGMSSRLARTDAHFSTIYSVTLSPVWRPGTSTCARSSSPGASSVLWRTLPSAPITRTCQSFCKKAFT